MDVYRISKCTYINDLTGTGARLYGGRWNSAGHAVVYTAGSRSLAALEVLVHIPLQNIIQDFCIATIHIPDSIPIKVLTKEDLPKGWQTLTPAPFLQGIGDEWAEANKYAVLRIPSVIIPEEHNYLINPLHPDAAEVKVSQSQPFIFDQRLISRRGFSQRS